MPAPFSEKENQRIKNTLYDLYVIQNKSLSEIAKEQGMSESGIYERLKRYQIPTSPHRKKNYLNRKKGVRIPRHSKDLAELTGINRHRRVYLSLKIRTSSDTFQKSIPAFT